MKLGIIGLPQAGKRTLFNLLTQGRVEKTKGHFYVRWSLARRKIR